MVCVDPELAKEFLGHIWQVGTPSPLDTLANVTSQRSKVEAVFLSFYSNCVTQKLISRKQPPAWEGCRAGASRELSPWPVELAGRTEMLGFCGCSLLSGPSRPAPRGGFLVPRMQLRVHVPGDVAKAARS